MRTAEHGSVAFFQDEKRDDRSNFAWDRRAGDPAKCYRPLSLRLSGWPVPETDIPKAGLAFPRWGKSPTSVPFSGGLGDLQSDPQLLQDKPMSASNRPNRNIRDTPSRGDARPSSSSSKDARALRSAQALRDALLCLLRTRSFDQITIRDICGEAKVHYATFFRHYQTKEQLLDDIAQNQIAQLSELALATKKAESFEAGFHALCRHVDKHRTLLSTLLNGGAGSAMREEWLRQSKKVAMTEPTSNGWLPFELSTICAASLIAETLAWWVAQPDDAYSVEAVAGWLHRLLVNSVIEPD